MDMVESIGLFAGLLTTVSMLPQVIKSYKSKKTNDLSLSYMVTLFFGLALWVIYGFMISNMPVILTNAASGALALALIYLKIRHG